MRKVLVLMMINNYVIRDNC